MNYFEFYGIPVSFQVNEPELKRVYYRNSKQYHPDFHTLSDETQQAEMLDLSSLNNEAFKTLSNQDARIRYVLELKGLLGDEKTPSALPQSFLLEMMDLNEALMDLEFEFDQTKYDQALQELQLIENQLETEVKPLLEIYTETADETGLLNKVREFYLKKRYVLRIRENLSKFAPAI